MCNGKIKILNCKVKLLNNNYRYNKLIVEVSAILTAICMHINIIQSFYFTI